MQWQPAQTAPTRTRVLVASEHGHVRIARRAPVRWYDDADSLMDPPAWWMPLPAGPAEAPMQKPPRRLKAR
jgi:hypothetical protein